MDTDTRAKPIGVFELDTPIEYFEAAALKIFDMVERRQRYYESSQTSALDIVSSRREKRRADTHEAYFAASKKSAAAIDTLRLNANGWEVADRCASCGRIPCT